MGKKTKSGRITLRTTPALHQQLDDLAYDLGMGLSDLVNLMVRRSLGQIVLEAHLYRQYLESGDFVRLFNVWLDANPTRPRREFLVDFRKQLLDAASPADAI